MMTHLWLWMRRGTGLFIPPTLLAFLAMSITTSHPWVHDANWGMRYTAFTVGFYTPLVAAAAAFDTSKKVHPTLSEIDLSAVRGRLAAMLPPSAIFVWAFACTLLGWAAVCLFVLASGGILASDWWLPVEAAAAYLAAVSLGSWIGSRVHNVAGAALAAATVLIASTLPTGVGLSLFQVATTTGTMLGIERTPGRAAAAVAVNLAVALFFVGVSQSSGRQRPRPPAARLATLAAAVGIAAAAQVFFPFTDSEYRPSTGPTICVGRAPAVCGPRSAETVLRSSQTQLARARAFLSPSGLPFAQTYAVARGEMVRRLGPDTAELPLDGSSSAGRLSRGALVQAFSAPHVCEAFFDDRQAPEYFPAVDTISTWLDQQLASGKESAEPAPEDVRAAYARLSTCRVVGER